ncbi:hypothetical protein EVAR_27559_1 [Eumeta japonica]|uniref:Uncharacterized protein n=1 Tax=Eumeta variegata TaxID=151549 RepID=A0A4C1WAU0_EUMVA|nr:hypothetical protein EVAR_27559_1 [Eumeta japonica]
MAMEDSCVSMRARRALTDNDIAEALRDSELKLNLWENDSGEDPEFVPPELNQRLYDHQTSDSSSLNEENICIPAATFPTFSSSSNITWTSSRSRSRGRGRGVSRGRGRGRNRGCALSFRENTTRPQSSHLSNRQIAISNRRHNDGFQDT